MYQPRVILEVDEEENQPRKNGFVQVERKEMVNKYRMEALQPKVNIENLHIIIY